METLSARVIANRENAKKSTGPKTEEGKARSRVNAFKHGLAGQGVAWPCEEQAVIDSFVTGQVELERPVDDREVLLAARAAILSWQIHRADRIEAANAHVRSARGTYMERERRADEVERLVEKLDTVPHRAARSLLSTAEGCEWILTCLREFVDAVDDDWWLVSYNGRLDALCLPPQPGLFRVSRAKVLGEALGARNLNGVWPNGIPDLEPLPDQPTRDEQDRWFSREKQIVAQHRPLWRAELRAILIRRMTEVEALLNEHLTEPDPGLELATLTASFDDSPAGERLRRYQRANIRERRATLLELAEWRTEQATREQRPEVHLDTERTKPDPEIDRQTERNTPKTEAIRPAGELPTSPRREGPRNSSLPPTADWLAQRPDALSPVPRAPAGIILEAPVRDRL